MIPSFWDEKYQDSEYVYGTSPNAFLKDYLSNVGNHLKILFPCDGEGRNAVYAASLGHEVTAFDFSQSGKEKALKLAKDNQVNIDYHVEDAITFYYGIKDFDLIVFVFAHFLPEVRHLIHQKAKHSLKQGGTILLEAFSPEQLENSSGGPKNPAMLYTEEILTDDFTGLQISTLQKLEAVLDEGPLHQGKASVVRLIARKD
jgi:SAM-dependent methyltransferase